MKFVQIVVSQSPDGTDIVYALGDNGRIFFCKNIIGSPTGALWIELTPKDDTGVHNQRQETT